MQEVPPRGWRFTMKFNINTAPDKQIALESDKFAIEADSYQLDHTGRQTTFRDKDGNIVASINPLWRVRAIQPWERLE